MGILNFGEDEVLEMAKFTRALLGRAYHFQKVEPMVEPVYVETRKAYKGAEVFMIRLNRAHKANAIDIFGAEHIIIALKAYQNSKIAGASILFGNGKNFTRGCDVEQFKGNLLAQNRLIDFIEDNIEDELPTSTAMNKPIVTAIEGVCFNGGLELAMNSDYIIACPDASFNLLPCEVGFPLVDQGCLRIAKIIGAEKTIDMMKSRSKFTAQEALDMGLINEIVGSSDELHSKAYAMSTSMTAEGTQLNWTSTYRNFYGAKSKEFALQNRGRWRLT